MVDIDYFKNFNDTYGHIAWDMLLRDIGEFLKGSIRREDIACRFGGEEFVLILLVLHWKIRSRGPSRFTRT